MDQKPTLNKIKYICKHMLNIDWIPDIKEDDDNIFTVLSLCQSTLEVMYLLGVGYYLYRSQNPNDFNENFPWISTAKLENGQPGIWFMEPWFGYCPNCNSGPSALLLVPQYKSPEKNIHHDFGIFTTGDNGGGPPWYLKCAIEIDGYAVHKDRRALDILRDSELSYDVFRFREELASPLTWFEEVVDCQCVNESFIDIYDLQQTDTSEPLEY